SILTANAVDRHHFVAEIAPNGRFDLKTMGSQSLEHPLGVAVRGEEDEGSSGLGEDARQTGGEALHHVRSAPSQVEQPLRLTAKEGRIEENKVETLPGHWPEQIPVPD